MFWEMGVIILTAHHRQNQIVKMYLAATHDDWRLDQFSHHQTDHQKWRNYADCDLDQAVEYYGSSSDCTVVLEMESFQLREQRVVLSLKFLETNAPSG